MIPLLVLAAGVYILVTKKIDFSKNRELVEPNSIYIGSALIVVGLLGTFFPIGFTVFMILFCVVIVASYFLGQKKDVESKDENVKDAEIVEDDLNREDEE